MVWGSIPPGESIYGETIMQVKTYKHDEGMGQITGFGGRAETVCQNMLNAGVRWLNERSDPEIEGFSFGGIHGMFLPLSKDSVDLMDVLLDVTRSLGVQRVTPLHGLVLGRLIWIKKNGWDNYVVKMRLYNSSSEPEDIVA